jgi:hypothetical protein
MAPSSGTILSATNACQAMGSPDTVVSALHECYEYDDCSPLRTSQYVININDRDLLLWRRAVLYSQALF